jgi:hypothetical protein
MAHGLAGGAADLLLQLFGAAQPYPHARRDALAQGGEGDAAPRAFEQAAAALLFQLGHLTAHVRLAGAVQHRHLAEAAVVGGVKKKAPEVEVHGVFGMRIGYV